MTLLQTFLIIIIIIIAVTTSVLLINQSFAFVSVLTWFYLRQAVTITNIYFSTDIPFL